MKLLLSMLFGVFIGFSGYYLYINHFKIKAVELNDFIVTTENCEVIDVKFKGNMKMKIASDSTTDNN